jgi:hypothetical protein
MQSKSEMNLPTFDNSFFRQVGDKLPPTRFLLILSYG